MSYMEGKYYWHTRAIKPEEYAIAMHDLGEPEQPGQQRSGQLDGLYPLERHLAVLPEEDALAQLDLVGCDAEAGEAPREPVRAGHDADGREHEEQGDERVGDERLRGVVGAAVGEAAPSHLLIFLR